MPTIKDIAREANVSVCTVSRYLNNKIVVRKETEERIQLAVKQLGYVPNVVAKSLKQNTTSNISVILPRINNLYYAEMTSGISQELARHQYHLFISEMENLHQSEEEVLRTMRENLIAGVIFIGLSDDESFRQSLHSLLEAGIPVVYMNRALPSEGFPLVYPDFAEASAMAAGHLAARGKKKLALVHRYPKGDILQGHVDSFCHEAERLGLETPAVFRWEQKATPDDKALDALLNSGADGVYVMNEMMSVGLLKALASRGVRVPEDLAVLGFGNSLMGELSLPELSCIDLQNHALGTVSARMIMQQINGEDIEDVTVLRPSIVQRRST